jgi:hypothetical protein
MVASGLEFLPTDDIKLFRGIGKELVTSKQAGHYGAGFWDLRRRYGLLACRGREYTFIVVS